MGLTLRRAGFALLVVLAVWLPTRRPTPEPTPVQVDRPALLQELLEEQRAARIRWIAHAERDSVLASTVAVAGGAPSIAVSGYPEDLRDEQAESTITHLWNAVGDPDSGMNVGIRIYNPAGYAANQWRSYSGNLIRREGSKTRCTAIVPGGQTGSGRLRVYSELLEYALAPCLLLAAFGLPGQAVGNWLDATRYISARSNSWLTKPAGYIDGHGGSPWRWVVGRNWTEMAAAPEIPKVFGVDAHAIATLLAPPYHYGTQGIRCLTQRQEACVQAVLGSVYVTVSDSGIPSDLTVGSNLYLPEAVTLATIRPPAEFFVSDLIRSHGRQRFRAFWKSELPFEAAFQQAFGQSLGEWTARWARRQWLRSWEARHRSEKIILGADLAPTSLIALMVWTILALGAAGWAAQRKTVT